MRDTRRGAGLLVVLGGPVACAAEAPEIPSASSSSTTGASSESTAEATGAAASTSSGTAQGTTASTSASSSTGAGVDTDVDGSGTTSGTDTGTSDACAPARGDTRCNMCVKESCCPEVEACLADGDETFGCACFVACVDTGATITECANTCRVDPAAPGTPTGALGACTLANCGAVCPLP